MPASDTGHLGIPSLPSAGVIGDRLIGFFEMCEMSVKLDDITDTYSTGDVLLTQLPPDIYLIKLSYRVTAPFVAATERSPFVSLLFGDSASRDAFGMLNMGNLVSTNCFGDISINWAATATDHTELRMFMHEASGGGAALSSGTLELWLHYRYNPSRNRLGGRRAK